MDIDKKIDLIKWFLSSFVLVVLTTLISFHFQQREQSLEEVSFYDKYATDLIVLNPDISKRRLLSQYFSLVTPNDVLRERWVAYHSVVDSEYRAINQLEKEKYPSYSSDSTHQETSVQHPMEFVLPNDDYSQASKYERLGWESLLDGKIQDAIGYFEECEKIYPSFHSVWEVSNFLRKNKNLKPSDMKKNLQNWTWKLPPDLKNRVDEL